jgi:AcrR family transcriptional regulator
LPRSAPSSRPLAKQGNGSASSQRRDEIVALAGEMFATRGFTATTVREIADGAGILSGSLYHHFDSKEAIVDALLSAFLDETMAAYERAVDEAEDPVEALCALVRIAFRAVHEHRAAVAVMHQEFHTLMQYPRFRYLRNAADSAERVWVGVLREGIRAGDFRRMPDPVLTYRFIRDAVWNTVRWYEPGRRYSIDTIANRYLELLLDGLGSE